jgi:hypothetical protein
LERSKADYSASSSVAQSDIYLDAQMAAQKGHLTANSTAEKWGRLKAAQKVEH